MMRLIGILTTFQGLELEILNGYFKKFKKTDGL